MRYLCLGLAACLLTPNAFGQFKVAGSGSAEYHMAESKMLYQAATELLNNDSKALLGDIANAKKNPGKAQAAGLMMLYADKRWAQTFVPPLVGLIVSGDPSLFYVGHKAVELNPAIAYSELQNLVRSGSELAAYELSRYGQLGTDTLKVMATSGPAKGRRAAMAYVNDAPTLNAALNDPNKSVVWYAVRTLLGQYQGDNDKLLDNLIQDRRPEVRAAAVTYAGRWSQQNWPVWVKLCHDPVPEIRSVAMLHMCALGLDWGKGPWVSDGIAAVGAGLHDKPRVQQTAIMAIRGWMLEWDKLPTRWSKADLAKAKAIIADPLFSRPILNAPKATDSGGSSEDREGIQMAQMLTTQRITKEVVESVRR